LFLCSVTGLLAGGCVVGGGGVLCTLGHDNVCYARGMESVRRHY